MGKNDTVQGIAKNDNVVVVWIITSLNYSARQTKTLFIA